MTNGQNFFDPPAKNYLRIYNIRNIATGPEDDYRFSTELCLFQKIL